MDTPPSSEVDAVQTFKDLGLIDELCEACTKTGFKHPTEIQRQSIPLALQNKDIIGLAQTGSGKTAAFALPILQALWNAPQGLFACVMAPTRELAFQISEQFEALGATIGVRTAVIIGGVDMVSQAIALSKKPHIVICTPGRLADHLENTKGFSLRTLKYLVMDEADRLLDMDFGPKIEEILKVIPKERRTFLFSATMTDKVAKLQRASLTNPVKVQVSNKYSTVETLLQYYIFFPLKYKDTYLTYLLNELSGHTCIIFTTTCAAAQKIALMLRNLGFPALPLHGQMSQPMRLGALNKFKSGQRSILVATDVVARGLDIPAVDLVLNYDLPTNSKVYIHRVGRTARAGRAGKSITLVTQYDVELFQRIETLLGKKLEEWPVDKEACMLLAERVEEAQRIAAVQMRDEQKSQGRGKGKRPASAAVGDDEEAAQEQVKSTKAKYRSQLKKKPPVLESVPLAPPDIIFHLTASYKADTNASKVNVGVGAYRTDEGKPWVLPVVRKAEDIIMNDLSLDHEYLPIEGLKSMTDAAAKLILGKDSPIIKEERYCSSQTISGTGAVRMGADFLARYKKGATVLLSNPTWANHRAIFLEAGFTDVQDYSYYHPETRGLDLDGMLTSLKNAPDGSIVVLHACAHNPTGVDPTTEQWKQIADVMESKKHFTFFDCAYQGFASGDVDRDASAIRYFAHDRNLELFVAQSFAKNFGLYGERCGCLTVVAPTAAQAKAAGSQIAKLVRAMYSNPPAYGARIVSLVLNDPSLYAEWLENLQTMSSRIKLMRQMLFDALQALGTPGSWNHILDQIGMFSYTGLNAAQSRGMKDLFHIYMTDNGRISMAGLTTQNVQYFAESLDWVVRNVH
ncbi:ribosomal RNA processing protein [Sorochytrium milnesiophthora]